LELWDCSDSWIYLGASLLFSLPLLATLAREIEHGFLDGRCCIIVDYIKQKKEKLGM
jgi:hypothetical protein